MFKNIFVLIQITAAIVILLFVKPAFGDDLKQVPIKAQRVISDNVEANASGRNVADFLTSDGQFDLDAARLSGYQGALDLKGF